MKTLMVVVMTVVASGCALPTDTRTVDIAVQPTPAAVLVVPASYMDVSDQVVGEENAALVLDGAS